MNRRDRTERNNTRSGAACYGPPRPPAPLGLKYAAAPFFKALFAYRGLAAVLALVCLSVPALAGGEDPEGPLTQADIDAYVHLAPRLSGETMKNNPEQAAQLLDEVKLTRRRAIYITAKIPVTQALASGLVSPDQLLDIPARLRPTVEEVQLVSANLQTLMLAENAAIKSSGVKVPRKRREVSRP
ncbi:MAG: hypothetical protein LBV70_04580 [Candidatus Adiutrix sp.]|jgi:hypothetical protein|nr:hypothetical protein [Candidatus Adiutrix sp.]